MTADISRKGLRATLARLGRRRHLSRAEASAQAFLIDPQGLGDVARARRLLAGHYLFGATEVHSERGMPPFTLSAKADFEQGAQDFGWLADLAALGEPEALTTAVDWAMHWFHLYGRGAGSGWTPRLIAMRLRHLRDHSAWLASGGDHLFQTQLSRSLTGHAQLLRRLRPARLDVSTRFLVLGELALSALDLQAMNFALEPSLRALAQACREVVAPDGSIAARNPEALLDLFAPLTMISATLVDRDELPPQDILAAIAAIAPLLRALRHADGGLARFHGGGAGTEGRLDRALALSGIRTRLPHDRRAMGYARLSAGRSTVIVDAAAPPRELDSAHASTLAFELTSGRRPLVVSAGNGESFGAAWAMAGRATPSHSVLGLAGLSSSTLAAPGGRKRRGAQGLAAIPQAISAEMTHSEDGQMLVASHDGYRASHGLTYRRKLVLSLDGRTLAGEEQLLAETDSDQRRLSQVLRGEPGGIAFTLRFHLHPDVRAEVDMNGAAVAATLKSREVWIFRHDGFADLSLEPSVWLQPGLARPRASEQIVLSARMSDPEAVLRWTFAKAQDTPRAIRDLVRDEETA